MVLGGPFTDGSGALVIVRVQTGEEARTIFNGDPWAVKEMLDGGEVKPWQMFFNALDHRELD